MSDAAAVSLRTNVVGPFRAGADAEIVDADTRTLAPHQRTQKETTQ